MIEARNPQGARGAAQQPPLWLRPVACAVICALALPPAPLLAQAPNRAAPAPAKAAEDTVMLNFVNADLEQTVRAIGQFTGRQFVIDPRVRGTLTVVTERPVTKQQAYEQLLAGLRLQGFTIVEPAQAGGIARILPEADAKLQGGRVIAPAQPAPRGDQIITQVFQLQYESVTNMVPVLRPLIAPNNTISAYPSNNTLVITDYAENLRRIGQIIDAIDQAGSADAEIIPLRFGLALEIASIVNRVLDEGARAAGQAVDGGQRVLIQAEPRTNSLIVRSVSRARLFTVKEFIKRLDQPSVTPGNINVVYLRNAQASRLAQVLRAVISADPSFNPSAGGTGGLSAASTPGQPGQPQAQPQAGGGGAGGAGGQGGPLGGLIQADAATNSLIITAPEPLYRNIRAIIEKLDVRPAQVVIESLIVEISADKAAEFGIQWQALGGFNASNQNSTSVIGGTNFGAQGNIIGAAQNLTTLGNGLNIGVIRGRITLPGLGEITNLGFLARALETNANGNVLSTPTIQTLDNEEAKFLVGQNVPFVTGSFTQGQAAGGNNPFQTFERRDVGIQLRVKPQISEGGVVRLAIYQEVSSVQPGTAAGGIITNKRSIESNVLVEDGNIVVLGGLIEDRVNNTASQVPLLGSIPLLGALFRSENRERRRTNLLVFLRPMVVRDEATSSLLAADRYDYMRAQVAQGQKPDSAVFRGMQGGELPPLPPPRPRAEPRADSRSQLAAPEVPVLTAPTVPPVSAPAPAPAPSAALPPPAPTPAPAPAPAPALPPPAAAVPFIPPTPPPPPEPVLPPPPAPIVPPPATLQAPPPREVAAPTAPPRRLPVSPRAALPAAATAPLPPPPPAAPPPPPPPPPPPVDTEPPQRPVESTPPIPIPELPPAAPAVMTSPATPTPAANGSARASGSFAASASSPQPTTGTQLIQVAAVSSIAKGRELQRDLRAAGFDAYWESVATKRGDVVRVRISVDRATQSVGGTLADLEKRGFKPILVNP